MFEPAMEQPAPKMSAAEKIQKLSGIVRKFTEFDPAKGQAHFAVGDVVRLAPYTDRNQLPNDVVFGPAMVFTSLQDPHVFPFSNGSVIAFNTRLIFFTPEDMLMMIWLEDIWLEKWEPV